MSFVRALLLLVFAASNHAATITAVCVNSRKCDVSGNITLRAVSDNNIQIAATMAHGIAEVTVDQRAEEWELELAANGFWMPRQILKSSEASRRVDVWRTALTRGRFVPDVPNQALPKSFVISAQSPFTSRGPTVPEGTEIDCSIGDDGSWACALPATLLDLTFRVKSFTPHYVFDANLKPATPTDWGSIRLRRGASLAAWLDKKTLRELKGPARARLVRMAMADASAVAQRLSQPVAEGVFNARGMVQLGPIPADTYSLEVSAAGFAAATISPLQVYEGKESALRQPVRLEPPVAIRVQVKPPRDAFENPWRVSVSRIMEVTGHYSLAGKGTTDDSGSFVLDGQSPGKYSVSLTDSHENRFANQEFAVGAQPEAQLAIDLSVIRLSGTVTLDKHPIDAKLVFGGHGGREQIRAAADDQGEFEVTLPRTGKWAVEVTDESENVRSAVELTVERGAPIDIDLPDTEIAGWIVGPDHARVNKANVVLNGTGGTVDQIVDSEGNFRFRGIPAGTAKIHARDLGTGEYSRNIEIPVVTGSHTTGLEIELQGLRTFQGVILSDGRPVAGARVTGYGFAEGAARQMRAVSNVDGTFQLSFPVKASRFVFVVASAGRVLQAFAASPSETPARFELFGLGGTLNLTLSPKAARPTVAYEDIDIPLFDLMQWAIAHGKRPAADGLLEMPEMAPGRYRFCADLAGSAVCREGFLARGSVLSLRIE